VPEFGGETSSATKAEEPALTQRIEEPATMPKVNKIEEPRIEETKISVLSPSAEVTVPKAQKRSYNDPQEEKDGQCARCTGDDKEFKLYSRENCRSFKNTG
jgi:7-cyano-7-deazaguanine synthase in queuosine biosynthesis